MKYATFIFLLILSLSCIGQSTKKADFSKDLGNGKLFEYYYSSDSGTIIKIIDIKEAKEYLMYEGYPTPIMYPHDIIANDSLIAFRGKRKFTGRYWLFLFDEDEDNYRMVNEDILYHYVGTIPKGYYWTQYELISPTILKISSEDPKFIDVIIHYDTKWGKTIFKKEEYKKSSRRW